MLASVLGCRQILGLHELPDDSGGMPRQDATKRDAPADIASEGVVCVGTLVSFCGLATIGTLALTDTFNTDSDPRCQVRNQPAGSPVCVVTGTRVTIPSTVVIEGSRPLAIVASDAIEVDAALQMSSGSGHVAAGANDASCPKGDGASSANDGGGGGAGGSFGAPGGDGGNSGMGPLGGTHGPAVEIASLRGGCAGGSGGDGGNGGFGVGGASGGAVYLIATNHITISGAVAANGNGGTGAAAGSDDAGGGGGGSGGLVALEAAAIDVLGAVIANGGGGGAAGGNSSSGSNGDSPSAQYDAAAKGGAPSGSGGAGGNGGAIGSPAAAGKTPLGGGGGGGGGSVGIVWTKGTLTGTEISPAPERH